MPGSNDALTIFIDAINQDELERRARTQSQIEADCARELESAVAQAKQQGKSLVNSRAERQREEMNRTLNDETAEMRKRLAYKREKIADSVFSAVEDKLREFTKAEEYPSFLIKSVQAFCELFPNESVQIFVRAEDMGFEKDILKVFGERCEVLPDSSIRLGGCKCLCASRALKADDTLDSRLEKQRESFRADSGLALSTASAEVKKNG